MGKMKQLLIDIEECLIEEDEELYIGEGEDYIYTGSFKRGDILEEYFNMSNKDSSGDK